MAWSSKDDLVVSGFVAGAYGVKGWIKVVSHTEPQTNLLNYKPWYLRIGGQAWKPVVLLAGKAHGKGIIAHFQGYDDRNGAQSLRGAEIAVPSEQLAALDEGEYYWHQLEGLRVETLSSEGERLALGVVSHLIETGANDVLVVKPDIQSIDDRERLIPYVDHVINHIDLEVGRLLVDWDPEY